MPIDRKDLPESNEVLGQMVIDLTAQVERMQRQIDYLTRQLFGRRSEKLPPLDEEQGRLFDEDSLTADAQTEDGEQQTPDQNQEDSPDTGEKRRRNKRTGDRPSLPKHLPRIERHHHPENLQPCPCCGKVPSEIGEGEASDCLEYIPGGFYVVRNIVHTHGCGCGEIIVKADAPMRPIIGGLPGPGTLAQVLTNKYADHIPLHRQERILERHEILIHRSVMCGWIKHCAGLLFPIYLALKSALLELDYIGFDATNVKVQEKGKGKVHRGTFWAYRSGRDVPVVFFEYTRRHNRDGPMTFLENFRGYVQADAHPHYDPLFKGESERTEVGCMSHARRPFERILKRSRRGSSANARTALGFIQTIFQIEEESIKKGLTPDERLELRQRKSAPVMKEFREWIDEMKKTCLPKTAFGKAVGYVDRHWEALTRFLEDGRLEIHNNFVEQELRKIALGRNNWIFFGNEKGAEWGAVMFSLVGSCRRAGVDPFLYFFDVLERISTHSRVEDLLPHRWKLLFEEEAKTKIAAVRQELRQSGVADQAEPSV